MLATLGGGAMALLAGDGTWSVRLAFAGFCVAVGAMRMGRPRGMDAQGWTLAVVSVAVLCTVAGALNGHSQSRRILAGALNLGALPGSVAQVSCVAWGFTDVLTRCAFALEPEELDAALRGWRFTGEPCTGTSHPREPELAVGPEFALAHCYRASPPEFEYGGYVTVAADEGRRRAVVDLYIE